MIRSQKAKAKPAAKAAAKPRKPAAPKAAPKKAMKASAAPKAKTVPKKRSKPDLENDSDDEDVASPRDDSQLSATPPSAKKQKKAPAKPKLSGKPLAARENEAMAVDTANSPKLKKITATERYQKVYKKPLKLDTS